MRLINKLIFIFKEALGGWIKNLNKTFIQLLVCYISLVFFGIIFGMYFNVQDAAKNMREKIEISVFIEDDATKEEILRIEQAIKSNTNIKKYEYISKDEAKEKGEEMFKDTPEMIEAIEDLDNPFPSSFNLELYDAENTEAIANIFVQMDGVEKDGVKYGEEYMDKILSLSNGLKYGAYISIVFFFTIAVFFMISIINLIVSAKQNESEIMFMIGASPIQIKLPFYIQGILLGLISGSLAYITFKSLYIALSTNISFMLVDFNTINKDIFIVMIVTGFLAGIIATKLALVKFNRTSRKVKKVRKKNKK